MNARLKLVSVLTLACLIVSSLLWVRPVDSVLATTDAEVGGFLLPWAGDRNINGSLHEVNGGSTASYAIDISGDFEILAPKDGTIVDFNDDMYSLKQYGCTVQHAGLNYLVLGHGPLQNGKYHHYSIYYHLARHSVRDLGLGFNSRVRTGQVIGRTGSTGFVAGTTGIHLHFYVTRNQPVLADSWLDHCRNIDNPDDPSQPVTADGYRTVPNSVDPITYGFEETHNYWPPMTDLPLSYNRSGGLLGSDSCDVNSTSAKVFLYNHIDYGGECVNVSSPDLGFNVPTGRHISSIYLDETWLLLNPLYFHTLTLWDDYNQTGEKTVISTSRPRLNSIDGVNWNDRIKSVHNALHSNAPWLLEESYAFQAPFNVNIHIRVANDPDFNAWRVCFDGENCQENAAPINELYYTWNTYGWPDGDHTISIQYRRTSDNFNWANADYYETSFYLNPNRQTYAPCGTNANGARITSGSDCIIVTTSVADMAPVGWADRSNLTITAQGYDVLAYDSSDFRGAPRLIRNGQTINAGGNVSGIELRQPLPPSYVPTEPLGIDSSTLVYLPMDEGSGSSVYNQAGSMVGSIISPASFTTGLFGSAIHSVNPPDGGGVNFGAQDFGAAFTVEMFVKMDNTDGDQRLATQVGGGPNTGSNKWLIGTIGDRFRIWSCWISGCHEGFSLDPIHTGRWYYLMFTYDGVTTAKLYVDSVLQTTLHMDGTIPGGATTFEIAKGENIYGCDCTIDDFRVSNIVREPLGPPAPTLTPMPTSTPIDTPTPTATYTPTPTSGPRTISVPQDYSTIGQAMEVGQSGDTILVAAGTYNEKFSVKSGVKVIGAGATTTTIRGDGLGVVVYVGGSAELSGFTVTNSGTDNWDAGIWVDNASGVISKNIVTGNTKGIVLYCFSPCATEPRIVNNVIYGNTSVGLFVHDGVASIINNTITNNFSGIAVDRAGITILNNNVTGNSFEGINGGNVSLTLDYNNFWNNGQNYSGATAGANDISIDPLYVSPSANDYHINSYSTLIDRGATIQGIADDIDIQVRPFDGNGDGNMAFDIGADEYVGPVAPTQAPTPTYTPTYTPSPTKTATPTATRTPTPTSTSTPTATYTSSPTPTNTPLSGPVNTGLVNPSSNLAQTGGDNNGYEVNATYAYANDGLFAVDNNSGNNTNTSCTNSGKDKHRFYNYGISLPGAAVIQGIEVRLDAKADSTSGSPKLCVQLSWDGGTTWTTAKSTSILSTAEQTFILGGAMDTWGHAWTTSQLSNASFRVRIIDVSSSTSRDFSLDWISVRLSYR